LNFFDTEFPKTLVHGQLAESDDNILSPFLFPEYKLILSSLVNIVNLNCYKNDPLLMSFVDGLITHFSNTNLIDIVRLKKFFEFNDKLDQSRNIQLKDYIPELEEYRQRCYNTV
jgi:hypothetical protein